MRAPVSRFLSGSQRGIACIPRTETESRGSAPAHDIVSRGLIGRPVKIDYTPGDPGMLPDISRRLDGAVEWARTLLGLFGCGLLHATGFPLRAKVFGIFLDLLALVHGKMGERIDSRARWADLSRARRGESGVGWKGSDLLLMTPPAEPEAILEIIPSFTAPFLPADPSGDVLHPGQLSSCLLARDVEDRRPGSLGAGQRSEVVTGQIFLPFMQPQPGHDRMAPYRRPPCTYLAFWHCDNG